MNLGVVVTVVENVLGGHRPSLALDARDATEREIAVNSLRKRQLSGQA
jgi:hypothetical protein